MGRVKKWSDSLLLASFTRRRVNQLALGLVDQGLSVGGTFLVNVVLARTQTKEEYGMFALSYSIFVFLAGLHNAAVLEPFTVYASGRYQDRFPAYSRLMTRSNAIAGLTLSGGLVLTCLLFSWAAPALNSRALLGLTFAVSFILAGSFLRRCFYIQRRPDLAARASLVFFITVAFLLWLASKTHTLNGFSVFLILALGWILAGLASIGKLHLDTEKRTFLKSEPHYWREHWKYTRWVLATAFVFQFMHQGYYWLVAGFISVREVGELKAMYVLIAPIEQVMISLSFLVLPALASKYMAQKIGAFLAVWKRYAALVAGITLLFAIFVRILGARLIHVVYAGRFDELAPMLFTLALVPLLMGIGTTMGDAIKAAEKPRLVFYAYVGSAGITFLVGMPLVMHLGLRGAVYGMLLSGAAYTGVLLWGFSSMIQRKTVSIGAT